MKTFDCVAKSGNTGKEIVVVVRANDSTKARMDAKDQAKLQFGSRSGAITIVSVKER